MTRRARRPAVEALPPPPSKLLLALEGRAVFEWAALALTWPWLPAPPRGDGHPVLVLPGLAAGDTSTWPLRKYLEQCGYAVHPWELGLNLGPRTGVMRKLAARVRSLEREYGQKPSLVGWSLGGALAKGIAVRLPDKVRSVITLGSPLLGDPRSTNAWRLFETVSGMKADDARLRAEMKRHPRVPMTSFLSRSDGIVAWRMSLLPDLPQAENIEVRASHLGIGANPTVLWAVAERLSQAEGRWKPFDRSGLRALFYDDPQRVRFSDAFAL